MIEIHDMPGHLIRRLQQISNSVFSDGMSEAGFDVTSVQFAALVAIDANPGLDQATLSGLIAYDRVTIGGVVDRLEQKGFVERIVSPRDRRARELHLTAEGRAALKKLTPAVRRVQTQILAGLSDAEIETFMRLLKKTTEAGNKKSRAPMKAG